MDSHELHARATVAFSSSQHAHSLREMALARAGQRATRNMSRMPRLVPISIVTPQSSDAITQRTNHMFRKIVVASLLAASTSFAADEVAANDVKRLGTEIASLQKSVAEQRARGIDPAHHAAMMKDQQRASEEIARLEDTVSNLRAQLDAAPQYLPQDFTPSP